MAAYLDEISNTKAATLPIPGVEKFQVNEFSVTQKLSAYVPSVEEFLCPYKTNLYFFGDKILELASRGNVNAFNNRSDVHYTGKSGITPLIVAAHRGHLPLVKILIQNGANVNIKSEDGLTALSAASILDRKDVVRYLLSTVVDVNVIDKDGVTPLLINAYRGNEDVVKELIAHGANVDIGDKYGRTAVMAASYQGHVKVLDILLQSGAQILLKTETGKTALFYAAVRNEKAIIHQLIGENQRILDQQDVDGNTVVSLMSALKTTMDVVTLFCDMRANLNIQNKESRTALMIASQNGNKQIVELLLKHGAKPDIMSKEIGSSIFYAALANQRNTLKFLANFGDLVNSVDKNGDTPLIISSSLGNSAAVSDLLEARANINHQNNTGKTALMAAVNEDHLDTVKLLVRKGGDINIKGDSGLSVLELALLYKRRAIVEFLKERPGVIEEKHSGRLLLMSALLGKLKMVTAQLNSGISVNYQDEQGRTALMASSQTGHSQVVKMLTQREATVNMISKSGVTALAYAIEGNHRNIIEWLISYQADIDEKDSDCKTLLFRCAASGNIALLKCIVQLGAEINLPNNDGKTPLIAASETGNKLAVEYLVEMGADIDIKCKNEMTAIDYASNANHIHITSYLQEHKHDVHSEEHALGSMLWNAANEGNLELAQRLINNGCPVNYKHPNRGGYTPMFCAVHRRNLPMAKLLMQNGGNLHVRGFMMDTALHHAIRPNNQNIVKWLLQCGANPNFVDSDKKTALMKASVKKDIQVVKDLILHGALVGLKDYKGRTALIIAADSGDKEMVEFLLKNDARLDFVDSKGFTAFFRACVTGHFKVVNILHQYGANINHRDSHNRTPLMASCQHGHISLVKFLVNNGADTSVLANDGCTARQYAFINGHQEIADWLGEQTESSDLDHLDVKSEVKLCVKDSMGTTVDSNEKEQPEFMEKIMSPVDAKKEGEKQLFDMCAKGWGFEDAIKFALDSGADINATNANGATPLILAIRKKHVKHIAWLIKYKADVDCPDVNGCTPIMEALKLGNEKIIEPLIDYGANLTKTDINGQSVLWYAVMSTKESIVEWVLKKTEYVNYTDNNGRTPLMAAIEKGFLAIVSVLLQFNSDINIKDNNNMSSLFYCARAPSDIGAVIAVNLIHNGAEIDHKDKDNETALMFCMRTGNVPLAKQLLSSGADINHVNLYKESIFQLACISENEQIIKIICEEISKISRYHITNTLKYLAWNNMVEVLVPLCHQNGDFNMEIKNGESIIFESIRQDNVELLRGLLQIGVDVDHRNCEGRTVLDIAVEMGNVESVECLLHHKRNLANSDPYWTNAYTIASRKGDFVMIDILLQNGKRPSKKDPLIILVDVNMPVDSYYTDKPIESSLEERIQGELHMHNSTAKALSSEHPSHNSQDNMSVSNLHSTKEGHKITRDVKGAELVHKANIKTHLENLMTSTYNLFISTVAKQCPKYIQCISRNWESSDPRIFIHLTKEDEQKARKCMENIMSTFPLVQLEYIQQETIPVIAVEMALMDRSNEIPGFGSKLFRDNDMLLLEMHVWKKGYSSDRKYGKVIDVNVCLKLECLDNVYKEKLYPGIFIVASDNTEEFAKPDDCGAMIFDEDNQYALGMIVGIQTFYYSPVTKFRYQNVAICSKISPTIDYADQMWKKGEIHQTNGLNLQLEEGQQDLLDIGINNKEIIRQLQTDNENLHQLLKSNKLTEEERHGVLLRSITGLIKKEHIWHSRKKELSSQIEELQQQITKRKSEAEDEMQQLEKTVHEKDIELKKLNENIHMKEEHIKHLKLEGQRKVLPSNQSSCRSTLTTEPTTNQTLHYEDPPNSNLTSLKSLVQSDSFYGSHIPNITKPLYECYKPEEDIDVKCASGSSKKKKKELLKKPDSLPYFSTNQCNISDHETQLHDEHFGRNPVHARAKPFTGERLLKNNNVKLGPSSPKEDIPNHKKPDVRPKEFKRLKVSSQNKLFMPKSSAKGLDNEQPFKTERSSVNKGDITEEEDIEEIITPGVKRSMELESMTCDIGNQDSEKRSLERSNPEIMYPLKRKYATLLLENKRGQTFKFIYGFDAELCDQSDINNKSQACGIIAALFSDAFMKHPSHIISHPKNIPQHVHRQVVRAVKQGNGVFNMNFDDGCTSLGPSEIMLMTSHLDLTIVDEIDFESNHVDILQTRISSLKLNETMLFFQAMPYKVFGIQKCDSGVSILVFDPQAHEVLHENGKKQMYGSFIFYGFNKPSVILDILESCKKHCGKLEGKCKLAIVARDES